MIVALAFAFLGALVGVLVTAGIGVSGDVLWLFGFIFSAAMIAAIGLAVHLRILRVASRVTARTMLLIGLHWPLTLALVFVYAVCRSLLAGPAGNVWEFYLVGLTSFTGLTAFVLKRAVPTVNVFTLFVPLTVSVVALWLVFFERDSFDGSIFPSGFVLIVASTVNAGWCGAVLKSQHK